MISYIPSVKASAQETENIPGMLIPGYLMQENKCLENSWKYWKSKSQVKVTRMAD